MRWLRLNLLCRFGLHRKTGTVWKFNGGNPVRLCADCYQIVSYDRP